MNTIDNFVIVDPIFRGSRLHYTELACKASVNSEKVMVLTRKGEDSVSVKPEGFEDANASGIFSLPEKFWYGRVGLKNALIFILWAFRKRSETNVYYFCGLNEWMPWFLLISIALRFTKDSVVVVDYEGKYWLEDKKNYKSKVAFLYRKLVLQSNKKIRVALLDERALDLCGKEQLRFLPDPAVISTKVELNPRCDGYTVFLTFGLQSERKGIRYIEELVAAYGPALDEAKIKIVCIGKLSNETIDISDKLHELEENNISFRWVDRYVSDDELVSFVSDSDAILLPYTPQFQGSSGVLAHSCAWGLPVLSSHHGLIGYRVNSYALGDSFKAGDVSSLFGGLLRVRDLIANDFPSSEKYKKGRSDFLNRFSESKHLEALEKIIKERV